MPFLFYIFAFLFSVKADTKIGSNVIILDSDIRKICDANPEVNKEDVEKQMLFVRIFAQLIRVSGQFDRGKNSDVDSYLEDQELSARYIEAIKRDAFISEQKKNQRIDFYDQMLNKSRFLIHELYFAFNLDNKEKTLELATKALDSLNNGESIRDVAKEFEKHSVQFKGMLNPSTLPKDIAQNFEKISQNNTVIFVDNYGVHLYYVLDIAQFTSQDVEKELIEEHVVATQGMLFEIFPIVVS